MKAIAFTMMMLLSQAAPKPETVTLVVTTRDGQTVRGSTPVTALNIRRGEDVLQIPFSAIQTLTLQSARPADLEKIRAAAEKLIEGLASDSIEVREKARQELLAIGWPAIAPLRRATKSSDPEVASLSALALASLESAGIRDESAGDVIEGAGGTLRGWAVLDEIALASSLGSVRVAAGNAARVQVEPWIPRQCSPGEISVILPDGSCLVGRAPPQKLRLKTPHGLLEIPAAEVRTCDRKESGACVIVTESGAVEGSLENEAFQVETGFGRFDLVKTGFQRLFAGRNRANLALASRGARVTGAKNGQFLIDGERGKIDPHNFFAYEDVLKLVRFAWEPPVHVISILPSSLRPRIPA